ncbi:minor tail protein [Rhodococcus phage Takoda]|uniref:Minor tail protein n=2 Tax=Rerduovirus TaxID=1982375 RepID=A0A1S5VY59_9CAUD|nr:minor tail protein [Rhodococcus phage Takoda]AQP30886.1 minor tail protein [Rhodococcus phage AngryOrchard]AWY06287.1 minor tail protein [Rhodococcus phage Takoda]
MTPDQSKCDMSNPREHFIWGLKNWPTVGGAPEITHRKILEDRSEHLSECGFVWGPYLATLADENGMIHVSQLPQQNRKYQPPFRGGDHEFNPGKWVPMETPEQVRPRLAPVEKLTQDEVQSYLQQLHAAGYLKDGQVQQDRARELT